MPRMPLQWLPFFGRGERLRGFRMLGIEQQFDARLGLFERRLAASIQRDAALERAQ